MEESFNIQLLEHKHMGANRAVASYVTAVNQL